MSAAAAGTVLRPLGGFESVFHTLGKAKSFNFLVAFVLSCRPLPHQQWTTALAAIQHSTPSLNAAIQRHAELGPVFVATDGRPIPLTFTPLRHAGQWCEAAGRELSEPFDDEQGPLLRVVVLEGEETSEVVVTCHHANGDGMSLVATVRRLLETLAMDEVSVPERAASLPYPICVEERVAALSVEHPHPNPETAASTTDKPSGAQVLAAATPTPTVLGAGAATVHALSLTAELTAALRQKAQDEKTTVNGALTSALALALRQLNGYAAIAGKEISLSNAIDLRPLLRADEALTFCATGGRCSTSSDQTDFWSIARSHSAQLLPLRNIGAVSATHARITQLASRHYTPEVLTQIWGMATSYDAALSNLKEVRLSPTYGSLTLTAAYGPGFVWGGENEQTVGVVTLHGRLHLLHSSYKPIACLLEEMQRLIEDAL